MKHVLLGALACLLSACATDRPLDFACPPFDEFRIPIATTPGQSDQTVARVRPSAFTDAIEQSFGRVSRDGVTAAAPGRPQVLVLSGGGQWGAFGATFLQGWSARGSGDAARPRAFDTVTGVSTGALQATYAFLGRDYDQKLVDAYTITSEKQLVDRHGSLFFVSHASMADIKPLETYVRTNLRPLLERVADAAQGGRKLFVGVVDGLDGRAYAIDLTEIARRLSGAERETCYVGALLASSAVPVVFRQVTINGRPYLDGGVRHSVFITEVQQAAGEAANRRQIEGDLYILMNGDLSPTSVPTLPAKLLPTLNRMRTIVFNQIELASVFGTASRYPGLRTRVATAAGNNCETVSDEEAEIFDPKAMECLRAYGRERWKQGVPWSEYRVPQD